MYTCIYTYGERVHQALQTWKINSPYGGKHRRHIGVFLRIRLRNGGPNQKKKSYPPAWDWDHTCRLQDIGGNLSLSLALARFFFSILLSLSLSLSPSRYRRYPSPRQGTRLHVLLPSSIHPEPQTQYIVSLTPLGVGATSYL